MSIERVVIVGAGQGGFQAAASLRQEKFDGAITLIGDERGLPYQRPPLSKAYLKDGDAAKLALRPAAFYETNAITYVDGVKVARIDRKAQVAHAENGATFPYDHLIIATGSRNRVPPIENLGLDGVLTLRTLADAEFLRRRAPTIKHAIVVGGGFIGLEFAAVARAQGIEVTLIEGMDRLMARAVSPAISDHFKAAHEQWGARLVFGQFVSALLNDGEGRVAGVRLANGAELPADAVLVAAGVQPNDELAADAGLAVQNGVVVDAFLRSSDPMISALGDCCAFPEPLTGAQVRLESVQAATDHARTIAKRLTGAPAPYSAAPWFWSDQGDRKLQIAGLGGGADSCEVREFGDSKLAVYCFKDDRLICVETVNAAAEHMSGRKILNAGTRVTRDDLEQCDYDLRSLAKR
ncbi:MAG: FAD-dependent oxidoreductase [Neomegalonema sp.]|nr:FAD-dependent oxidoreductase [Neomegalonema sp.]